VGLGKTYVCLLQRTSESRAERRAGGAELEAGHSLASGRLGFKMGAAPTTNA